MAKSRKSFTVILIIVLAAALLVALNPTMSDFKAWRAGQAESQATSGDTTGLIGVMKKGAGAIAGGMVGLASGFYERNNYYLFSTFSAGKKGDLYLGAARLFIKLR
jgi:hypothetical protein